MKLNLLLAMALGASLLTVTGCATIVAGDEGTGGLPEQPIDAPPPPPPGDPVVDETPPPPPPPPPELLTQSLAWENGSVERAAWSAELRTQVAANLTSFDKASDMASFCPAYGSLTKDQKVEVLSTLIVGIARYESGYDPRQRYHEPDGSWSVGLYQLSYTDGFSWCTLNEASKSLEDPINNIKCAVPKMARLVARDKVFAAGSNLSNAMGLARYWSVTWLGRHISDLRGLTSNLAVCIA